LVNLCSGRRTKLAKQHLKEVGELLLTIDPNLAELAKNSKPISSSTTTASPKKRKVGDLDANSLHVPKKKNARSHDRNEAPTLSQREEKAMNNLIKHVEECGGKLKPRSFWFIDTRCGN